jgi:hypothetical protein
MKHSILQKYYVYDPGVHAGDELGSLRVLTSEEGLFVLAAPQQVQYWFDQGLLGAEPASKLSAPGKKFLAQITRGRSENPDDKPKRVGRYSKLAMLGAPAYAVPASSRMKKKVKTNNKTAPAKPKAPTPPPA